jgi:CubicO group peptidase (beta-lactamase class C family)
MKRLLWLLPVLFVAALSAASSIPQQGTAALSTFLTDATDTRRRARRRGDRRQQGRRALSRGVRQEQHAAQHADGEGHIFNIASMTKAVTSVRDHDARR